MFNTLLESKASRQQRAPVARSFSVILHVVTITGAIYATAHAGIKNEKEKVEKLDFVRSEEGAAAAQAEAAQGTSSSRHRRRRDFRC